jgi:uncharacterized membrane protein YuzA (DUF378 family)
MSPLPSKTKLDWIALIVVIIGALNWGILATINFNLVDFIFRIDWLARVIYTVVGLAGIYLLTAIARPSQTRPVAMMQPPAMPPMPPSSMKR